LGAITPNAHEIEVRRRRWLSGHAPVPDDVDRWRALRLAPAWRRVLLDEDARLHEAMGQPRDA